MSIIRAARPQSNFYILDKRISEDQGLSWGARGLLIFLLGKPDHWKVSVEHLRAQTQTCSKPSGRDAIYAMLTELIDNGYVKRELAKGESGTLAGYDYYVFDEPVTCGKSEDSPCPAFPDPAEPDTAQPYTANPTLVRTDSKKEPKIARNEGRAARSTELPDWLPLDSWQGFVDMRKKIRKPMTERATALMLKKLGKFFDLGLDVGAILDASTLNGWQDVYESKGAPQRSARPNSQQSRSDANIQGFLNSFGPSGDDPMVIEMGGMR